MRTLSNSDPKFSIILAAAGQSTRFGNASTKKPFMPLGDKPVWLHSADRFADRSDVHQMVIVIAPSDREYFESTYAEAIARLGALIVSGGATRPDSVSNGLRETDPNCDFIAIHDAARPLIDDRLLSAVFETATASGAAIPAIPVHSTVKYSVDGARVDKTIDRAGLYLAQTPQVFSRETICRLYEQRGDLPFTDESQLAERCGVPVSLVPGSPTNFKITTQDDLTFASHLIGDKSRKPA